MLLLCCMYPCHLYLLNVAVREKAQWKEDLQELSHCYQKYTKGEGVTNLKVGITIVNGDGKAAVL